MKVVEGVDEDKERMRRAVVATREGRRSLERRRFLENPFSGGGSGNDRKGKQKL